MRWVAEMSLLVSAGEDGRVGLVDVRTRGLVRVFEGHARTLPVRVKWAGAADAYEREVVRGVGKGVVRGGRAGRGGGHMLGGWALCCKSSHAWRACLQMRWCRSGWPSRRSFPGSGSCRQAAGWGTALGVCAGGVPPLPLLPAAVASFVAGPPPAAAAARPPLPSVSIARPAAARVWRAACGDAVPKLGGGGGRQWWPVRDYYWDTRSLI